MLDRDNLSGGKARKGWQGWNGGYYVGRHTTLGFVAVTVRNNDEPKGVFKRELIVPFLFLAVCPGILYRFK